jgi:hypothetical protein
MAGMASRYREPIFEYIKLNEPIMKQQVVRQFNYIAPKTVYQNISALVKDGDIFLADDDHTLTLTKQGIAQKWPTHPALKSFQNYSVISNMYACRDERLKALASFIFADIGKVLGPFMLDLIILGTVASVGFELSDGYEQKNEATLAEIDLEALKQRFQKVAAIL